MRVFTKIVIDMGTLEVLECDGFDYSGPIASCKGDKSAKAVETSQAGFTKTLQGIFQNNNNNQQQQLDFLNKKMQASIDNPTGFAPKTLAAMKTNATEQSALDNAHAVQALGEKEATQGGPGALPSGVDAQLRAGIAESATRENSGAQLDIAEKDAQQQQENYWNAVKTEGSVASLENPEGFAGATNSAAGTVSNLSDAVTKAEGPGVGSILGGVVGAGLGAAGSYFGAKKG